MSTFKLRILVVFACCAVWCCQGGLAMSQVRGASVGTLSNIGSLRSVGTGQSGSFLASSSGGGALQATGGGYQAGGVLRSSMAGMSQLGKGLWSSVGSGGSGGTVLLSNIDKNSSSLIGSSSGGGVGVTGTVLAPVSKGATLVGAAGFSLESAGGKGMAGAILNQDTSLAAARGFIASVGASGSIQKSDESIKTLVPDRPGQYRDKMQRGEEFLRAGSFLSAYEQFKVASDIVGRSPEPFLNMAHARFGAGGYRMTAFYIRRALTYMPELPLVALRPKNFYENIAVFGDLIIRLEAYLDENSDNGDALLVLAYFRWFAERQEVATVRSLLEKALAVSKSEDRIEAIHIFWRAMVKSGKVTGELKTGAATKPSGAGRSTTRSADQAVKGDKAPRSSIGTVKTSSTAGKQVP